MKVQRYSVNQHLVETVLAWVKADEIAIPEIQRPFVWDSSKVRDLMDSLYHGYPIGYLIAWKNPDVKLKDGTLAEGRKILIDGQQRVMALKAAILGHYVINKNYKRTKIKISFNPLEERFEVFNPAIDKDNVWIKDISLLICGEERILKVIRSYCELNPSANVERIEDALENLKSIVQKQVGYVELAPDLDIETVTEIFIRINSQGVVLSQADFAMSKIAANESYNGSTIRKAIDYFCHLAITPEFYPQIVDIDITFTKTNYFTKMSWLKNENDDLYDPKYTDLLRVAFTAEFGRGRLSDLVSLLSGRNFEKKTYEDEIARESFERLEKGIYNFINENNFKNFVMSIKSAGFVSTSMIRSQNALNFAYIVYLKLRSSGYDPADIECYVRKWFVLSVLTGRYSGSPESQFDFDIKNISSRDFKDFLGDVEAGELSDAFWDASLVQSLNTSVTSSPYFHVFLASQVKANDKGLLSSDINVQDLISIKGDIHHIFPRDYLKKNRMKRRQYNQVANYVYMQSEINIKVANKAPSIYFSEIKDQCNGGTMKYGGIKDLSELVNNLKMNCIPSSIFDMDVSRYEEFLDLRRKMMAKKIKKYYSSL